MILQWKDKNGKILKGSVASVKVKDYRNTLLDVYFENEEYENIRKHEYFHLSDENINKPVVKRFNEDKEFEIELKLNPDLSEEYGFGDLKNNSEIMNKIKENEKLTDQHSWYVLNVKQEEDLPEFMKSMGTVKTGFSTTWNSNLE